METSHVLAALSQPTRWKVFRLLVDSLPDGMAAVEIAAAVGTSRAVLYPHLAILSQAGLVSTERTCSVALYRARTEGIND